MELSPGSVRVFSDALYDGESLVQEWGGETEWTAGPVKAGLEVSYILNTLENPDIPEDYFSSWILDYRYLLPSGASVNNREAHHVLKTGLNLEHFSLNWNPELRIKTSRSPSWNQENRWAGTLRMPLVFSGWSFSSAYRRDLRMTVDATGRSGGYGDAWSIYGETAAANMPFFTYLPFRELLGSRDGDIFRRTTEGMSAADYETEFSLDLSRRTGSGILDLLLPSSTDFSMERRYHRKGDTVGWGKRVAWFHILLGCEPVRPLRTIFIPADLQFGRNFLSDPVDPGRLQRNTFPRPLGAAPPDQLGLQRDSQSELCRRLSGESGLGQRAERHHPGRAAGIPVANPQP